MCYSCSCTYLSFRQYHTVLFVLPYSTGAPPCLWGMGSKTTPVAWTQEQYLTLYILCVFLNCRNFSLKGSTLRLPFAISKLPASLSCAFGAIVRQNKGGLDASAVITQQSVWTEMAPMWRMRREHRSMDVLDKGVICVPSRREHDSMRVQRAARDGSQFQTYEFISGIFHGISSDCSWPQVTGTVESETLGGTTVKS